MESSYAGGVKPGQCCSRNRKREWALSFRDYSRVMIGYLKPMVPVVAREYSEDKNLCPFSLSVIPIVDLIVLPF